LLPKVRGAACNRVRHVPLQNAANDLFFTEIGVTLSQLLVLLVQAHACLLAEQSSLAQVKHHEDVLRQQREQ
jgi:hypothetical protein